MQIIRLKKYLLSVACLLVVFIPTVLFAAVEKPRSVLPPKMTNRFTEPSPERMARDNSIKLVDQYENDPKVEKYTLGVTLNATWREDAAYVFRDSSSGEPSYEQWNYQCNYISRFTTRLYKIPQPLQPAKIVLAETSFFLYPKDITGSMILQDSHNRLVTSGVRMMPSPSMASAQENVSFNLFDMGADNFQLSFALSGGIMQPMAGQTPLAAFTPFMEIMEPNATMDLASMSPAQVIASPASVTAKVNQAYFRTPINIENISIRQLKTGPVTRTASDMASGRGLIGAMPKASGRLNCSFNISATIYLKRAYEGEYVPGAQNTGPGEYVPVGAGREEPGVVKRDKPSSAGEETSTGKTQDKKKASGGAGRRDMASEVRAKAERMMNRALRESGVNSTAAGFTGAGYLALTENKRASLINRFINAGKEERVTIAKGFIFYYEKLRNAYSRHPEIGRERLVDTMTTLIVMEYDWSEPGIDKDTLARQYLGDEVYNANRNRRHD